MKCRYCGEELGDPELCPEGEQLWCRLHKTVSSGEWSDEVYDEYQKHLVDCKECQRRLGLTDKVVEYLKEMINESDELDKLFDVNNFEDPSERGKKKQCIKCHKWFYRNEMTSEYGISYTCLNCWTGEEE